MDGWWLGYLALGGAVGFFAGLLGVGGGGIMVPVLTTLFVMQGVPIDQVVHLALGTSMAAIIVTSLASLRAHHQQGAVRWEIVRSMTPGILIGTFMATFIASRVASMPLAIFFTLFMAYVSLQMLVNTQPKPTRRLPGSMGMALVGSGIGGVSALVAIGGGSLSVPFMTWCNIKLQQAIGTSAALGLPIALAGTLGYLVNGWSGEDMPPLSLGFIYLPAFLLISAVSIYTAPLGAQWAHRLPTRTLKRIFAFVLLLLCAKMLYVLFA